MSIFLIRHGETAGNAARILQKPDIPLSERGLAQAERVARRLAGAGITAILSSDMTRAAMTAEALARATGLPIRFEPLLHERNFGDLRGRPYADLGFDPFDLDYAPPNGESWPDFHARVDAAWARIRAEAAATPGHLAVVSHGLVCKSLAGRHLALPDGAGVPERWENTSVTVIDARVPWRVELLNCCAHLEDLPPAAGLGIA
ncbi:MAG TPA: histidine phosphatase family protein [Terriglobales bacterium]|nr:histidine phosphatase family protein [Terriglobales bacterium]